MYYQQSYVLILSHEMALFPFTYYLNFNYVNDSLIISCVREGSKVLSYSYLDCKYWRLILLSLQFTSELNNVPCDKRIKNITNTTNSASVS